MKLTSTTIFWLSLAVIGIAIATIFISNNPGDLAQSPSPSDSMSPSLTVSASPTKSVAPTNPVPTKPPGNNGIIQTPVPRHLITGPATCQLEGKIVFQSQNTYITEGAKMKFQNVDDSARLIYWTYTPNDGTFTAGPNIFANVRTLPNGELTVGATWQPDKQPTVKNYQLTAVITYGVPRSGGGEDIKQAKCAGAVTVTTP